MKTYLFFVLVLILIAPAMSAPLVDGIRDVEYGAPIVVQQTETQFGDASPPSNLGGSELDAAYAKIEGGRLYLLLTGNLDPNFANLEIFIDSRPGGENTLTIAPQYDFGWSSQNLGGLKFDVGFDADYHLFSRWRNGTGWYDVDFIDRQYGFPQSVPGSAGSSHTVTLVAIGAVLAGNVGPNASGSALTQNLDFAINDNNQDGVLGGTGAANTADAAAVITGMEFSIALADLGNPAPESIIKIAAMIDNEDHNYLSNQVLGPLVPPQENLVGDGNGGFTGTLGGVNFNQFAGFQFFTIDVPVPEPTVGVLGMIAMVGLARRMRRAVK